MIGGFPGIPGNDSGLDGDFIWHDLCMEVDASLGLS